MLQNLYTVIRREIRIMRNRPIYLLGSVGVMLAATLFFTTFMKEGIPEELRIGVVDLDNSSTSRNFRQQLDATQMGQVVEFASLSAAQRELETGRINGYVVVPEHFDREVQAFHCPKLQVQVNLMYPVIGGALAYKDILYMVNLTNGAVQRQVLRAKGVPEEEIMGRLQPVTLDAHNIGNAPTNVASTRTSASSLFTCFTFTILSLSISLFCSPHGAPGLAPRPPREKTKSAVQERKTHTQRRDAQGKGNANKGRSLRSFHEIIQRMFRPCKKGRIPL